MLKAFIPKSKTTKKLVNFENMQEYVFKQNVTKYFIFKIIGLAGAASASGLGLTLAINSDLLAADHGCQPAKYPWYHDGLFNTFDHAR